MLYDKKTGFAVGDPNEKVFPDSVQITDNEKEAFLKHTIFSVSGWRRVFAVDENEESLTEQINVLDKILVASAARLFAEFVKTKKKSGKPVVVLGLDARPTGTSIGLVMLRSFLAYGCDVRYVFIGGAPEVMSYAKTTSDIDGFMYVTASHNPVGHNGLKFGLSDGAVLGRDDAQPLIDSFKKLFFDHGWVVDLIKAVNDVPASDVDKVLKKIDTWKGAALCSYWGFTHHVITGLDNKKEQEKMISIIREKIKRKGMGVLAEFNGSSRAVSIDVDYLMDLGLKVTAMNDTPRQIVHRIVPEGVSLDLARQELEKLAQEDKRYRFAYVPDCDGDRGNIVTLDKKGKSWVLQAQEVFALSVVSELAYLVYAGKLTYDENGYPQQKVAVVVNGPTSGRIDKIAVAFGAQVFRAEVGEANVVSLALQKQREGYLVRILGEGSNGGNITLPSTVRDPINTIFAFIKMLVLNSDAGKPGLLEIWCSRSKQMNNYDPNAELFQIVETLPKYTTTSAFEANAVVNITTEDHAVLKENYENIFLKEWEAMKDRLYDKFGIINFGIVNYEGTVVREGIGPKKRTGAQRGGFKVIFYNTDQQEKAFIWMRGSGTEPVFRVLADVEGDNPAAEKFLLDWHVSLIRQADNA